MAEPPSSFTELLRSERYSEFITEVRTRGWLRETDRDLQRTISELQQALRSQRHPPGPTIEWLLIERLIEMQILDEKIRDALI